LSAVSSRAVSSLAVSSAAAVGQWMSLVAVRWFVPLVSRVDARASLHANSI
jgi:hypothetical protein